MAMALEGVRGVASTVWRALSCARGRAGSQSRYVRRVRRLCKLLLYYG